MAGSSPAMTPLDYLPIVIPDGAKRRSGISQN
jgi:hypothetical protein